MPIMFHRRCGKKFRAQEEHAGKRVRCTRCRQVLVVPLGTENPLAELEVDPANSYGNERLRDGAVRTPDHELLPSTLSTGHKRSASRPLGKRDKQVLNVPAQREQRPFGPARSQDHVIIIQQAGPRAAGSCGPCASSASGSSLGAWGCFFSSSQSVPARRAGLHQSIAGYVPLWFLLTP